MDEKIIVKYKIRCILIELSQIFPMEPSDFKIFISVGSYDEKLLKITEILRCRKAYYIKTIKDVDLKFYQHKLMTLIKVVSKFHFSISYTFEEMNRQRALVRSCGSVWVRPVHRCKRFSSSENGHKTLFQFFLKVLEPSECRRGDPYKTANRNLVRFDHS